MQMGGCFETTWAVDSLRAAREIMRRMHPLAAKIEGEYVMTLAEYLG